MAIGGEICYPISATLANTAAGASYSAEDYIGLAHMRLTSVVVPTPDVSIIAGRVKYLSLWQLAAGIASKISATLANTAAGATFSAGYCVALAHVCSPSVAVPAADVSIIDGRVSICPHGNLRRDSLLDTYPRVQARVAEDLLFSGSGDRSRRIIAVTGWKRETVNNFGFTRPPSLRLSARICRALLLHWMPGRLANPIEGVWATLTSYPAIQVRESPWSAHN